MLRLLGSNHVYRIVVIIIVNCLVVRCSSCLDYSYYCGYSPHCDLPMSLSFDVGCRFYRNRPFDCRTGYRRFFGCLYRCSRFYGIFDHRHHRRRLFFYFFVRSSVLLDGSSRQASGIRRLRFASDNSFARRNLALLSARDSLDTQHVSSCLRTKLVEFNNNNK